MKEALFASLIDLKFHQPVLAAITLSGGPKKNLAHG
jgi:hypothetical protein